jgi:acyl-CoA thioesterase FadM
MNSNQTPLFKYEMLIPFHYVDRAGILFFAHTFTIAHETLEHFIVEKWGIPWNQWFNNTEWAVPIKESRALFQKPIYGGIPCHTLLFIESLSNSSISFKYCLYQSDQLCCEVTMIHVFCNREEGKQLTKRAIPEFIRSKVTIEMLKEDS